MRSSSSESSRIFITYGLCLDNSLVRIRNRELKQINKDFNLGKVIKNSLF